MAARLKSLIFVMFFLSGFSGLLYQVVWIRIAYAHFGIITPVLSVIISVFMLGLALGSWAGGKWISPLTSRFNRSSLALYGLAELIIGIGAFTVPVLFSWGERLLFSAGEMNSAKYLFCSAAAIGLSILPWCVVMGFTYPFMMSFLSGIREKGHATSFSYLYFANVLGAMSGTLLTALVLIELFGFRSTLRIGALFNFLIAVASFVLSSTSSGKVLPAEKDRPGGEEIPQGVISRREGHLICVILTITGFASMGMEVVWVRAFTPVLKTLTYSFASLLTTYLLATWIGSCLYRRHIDQKRVWPAGTILAVLTVVSFFPLVMNDPRLEVGIPTALFSIFPLSCALGYLTPQLIDRYSLGEPVGAGRAYALNMLGCIVGPLFSSYVLLPFFGVKLSLIILSIPFLLLFLMYRTKGDGPDWSLLIVFTALLLFLRSIFVNAGYEEVFMNRGGIVRRDHTATVVSIGQGMQRRLLVNGISITYLTPITKVMAHLPLA
ncbi:MAG: hypothetical protein V1736_05710, partial [Pseudomonadota bacterium]